MSAELIIATLKTYGPWGLLLVVVIFVVLKGEFSFRYPRTRAPRARRKT